MNAPMNSEGMDKVAALRARLARTEQELAEAHAALGTHQHLIKKLEDVIARLAHRQWGRSSERAPGQGELSLFNEAELAAMLGDEDDDVLGTDEATDDTSGTDQSGGGAATAGGAGTGDATSAPPRRRRRRVLPDHLERVRIRHELDEIARIAPCGALMVPIGEEITEHLGVVPAHYFVTQHVKVKYACPCGACGVTTAPMPASPLPGTQASPVLLAWSMVAKYHDALPLYRQERIARTMGVELPRGKLARWLIASADVLQPLYNLLQDAFFDYDIALTDDTSIQVLKEDGRAPSAKSALFIRRGGEPRTPVVLVDYRVSKGVRDAAGLLSGFQDYLVSDGAPSFESVVRTNGMISVLCNDHARRRFVEAERGMKKKRGTIKGWIATKGIAFYKALYGLEREIRALPPDQRLERRRRKAVPIWETFMAWAKRMQIEGVRDACTRDALGYLIKHEQGLRRYCEEGRLPISNIQSEHVAKTVALSRKNFLFADTPSGASASAMIYSVLESAKANGHTDVLAYMTGVLSQIRGATTVEALEALLPWNLTPERAKACYAAQPWPGREKTD